MKEKNPAAVALGKLSQAKHPRSLKHLMKAGAKGREARWANIPKGKRVRLIVILLEQTKKRLHQGYQQYGQSWDEYVQSLLKK